MKIPRSLTDEQKEIILDQYYKGTTIHKIGKLIKRRSIIVSNFLRKEMGIDTVENRCKRIGDSQRYIPKTSNFRKDGIVNKLNDVQWAYIAGIFDGEGNISPVKTYQHYRISIAQKKDWAFVLVKKCAWMWLCSYYEK
jgi:intein/homing endonuclease